MFLHFLLFALLEFLLLELFVFVLLFLLILFPFFLFLFELKLQRKIDVKLVSDNTCVMRSCIWIVPVTTISTYLLHMIALVFLSFFFLPLLLPLFRFFIPLLFSLYIVPL